MYQKTSPLGVTHSHGREAVGSSGVVLPEPMLARADSIPSGAGWTFEPKLDGFRCLVCTHAGFRARGIRRGYYTDNREDALIMWKDPVPSGVAGSDYEELERGAS